MSLPPLVTIEVHDPSGTEAQWEVDAGTTAASLFPD
ncbi:MAG: hypothetical protein QOK39_270, partial [Acidimicrobiaceae bacterium]|nr:hypothetical protein [Acidimicrobiaceae bacterium]